MKLIFINSETFKKTLLLSLSFSSPFLPPLSTFFRFLSSCSQVAEQLFRPLVFQMIHWFTRNTQYESPDTMALLDAILVRQNIVATGNISHYDDTLTESADALLDVDLDLY